MVNLLLSNWLKCCVGGCNTGLDYSTSSLSGTATLDKDNNQSCAGDCNTMHQCSIRWRKLSVIAALDKHITPVILELHRCIRRYPSVVTPV